MRPYVLAARNRDVKRGGRVNTTMGVIKSVCGREEDPYPPAERDGGREYPVPVVVVECGYT